MIMKQSESWPPVVQSGGVPIQGGWSVVYSAEGLPRSYSARGSTPQGVLNLIVLHRASNDLPHDVDGVKEWLEAEWYKRDPRRFSRPPRKKVPLELGKDQSLVYTCDSEAWFGSFMGALNAMATTGSKQGIISITQALQELVKSGGFKCEKCDLWISAFMKQNRLEHIKSVTLAQNWVWEFQSQLARHLGKPIKPREVVEDQWCWKKTS